MFPQFQLEFLEAIAVPEVRSRNSLFMEDDGWSAQPIRGQYWGKLTNQRPSYEPISRPGRAGAQFQMCRRFEKHFGFRHRLAWAGWADSISLRSSRSNENVSPLYKWVISRGWLATTAEKLKKAILIKITLGNMTYDMCPFKIFIWVCWLLLINCSLVEVLWPVNICFIRLSNWPTPP